MHTLFRYEENINTQKENLWKKTQSNENKFSFQNIDSDVRFIKDLIWKIYPRQDVLGIKRKKVDQKCSKY